jgi:hypothetical protein
MQNKFTPSVNILRDAGRSLEYVLTPNAERVTADIGSAYKKGIHSFTIIGSYGTGKSSFLMALDRTLQGESVIDLDLGIKPKKIETLRIVGQYQSLIKHFHELFDITDDFDGSQKVFDHLHQLSKENDLLVIYLDEFGKFLEYASKFNPEKELYFLQQLAEFANDHEKEILLISTLHQNFEAYAANVVEDSQKKEWRKVKGRFKELTFNEPVEQLLFLAAKKLKGTDRKGVSRLKLAKEKFILPFDTKTLDRIDSELAPLDIISAAVLTKALQRYGQNERSLFTFLEEDIRNDEWLSVGSIYDYLLSAFYSFLHSSYNSDYKNWQAIRSGLERIEAIDSAFMDATLEVFKTIGLLQVFGSKAAHVDTEMIREYFVGKYDEKTVYNALGFLEKRKLVVFAKYNNSYKIIEGTDVDFDFELQQAEGAVDRTFDISAALSEYFDFPVIQAKEVSYKKGTPRLFAFEVSDEVATDLKPIGALDGYVNLVFNDRIKVKDVKALSEGQTEAILYGYYTNSNIIKDRLFEILKTKKVLEDHIEDRVAKQEFEKIQDSQKRLLSYEVLDSLYSEKVRWFFQGKELGQMKNQRALNAQLSEICNSIYDQSPVFNNELVNKFKISSSIHTARKGYFKHLAEHWNDENLGFEKDKFPPEKTIYNTLVADNGMHVRKGGSWELDEPKNKNGFDAVWNVCKSFLESTQEEKKSISELWSVLEEKPFKLKLGLVDFWVPTFLFTNRGDFALYEVDTKGEARFVPELNDSTLYMMTRQPNRFQVKAFEITGLRLRVFNKYREILEQGKASKLGQDSFIESVRPFLVFYRSLNEYAKQTERLSFEASELRAAILDAKDPEKTFFEAIPKALRMELDVLDASDSKLAEFAVKLNDAIQELKGAYGELLNRIETFICTEILGKTMEFEGYKNALAKRYKDVKEHRLLPKQKVFLARLNSPLNDRDSWLASIGQSLLGKPLERIADGEEDVLKDRIKHIVEELDNLQEIHKMKIEDGEQVFKLDVTTADGMRTQNVHISKKKLEDVKALSSEVEKLLAKNKNLTLAVLGHLLGKELKK